MQGTFKYSFLIWYKAYSSISILVRILLPKLNENYPWTLMQIKLSDREVSMALLGKASYTEITIYYILYLIFTFNLLLIFTVIGKISEYP
jgi:hypothetical protein